ncbi:hypothetical protein TWF281_005418 [Arthrobotrys megalospora]
MGEAFGIQLAFMLEDSPEKPSPTKTAVAVTTSTAQLSASSGSVRDTSFCENFYKFDLQPKMTTWPKGYKHPIQEWEFCPLQQGNPVHPSMAFTRSGRPRPTIEIPPKSGSQRITQREFAPKKREISSPRTHGRAMSESRARSSIVSLSPGLWQRKRSATQKLSYDKNRPLPPLPLRIQKGEDEGLQLSLSFRRKRENMKRRQQLQREVEGGDLGTVPPPIKLPPRYTEEEAPKTGRLEATTPGMGDAEVITIGLEGYVPPVPVMSQNSAMTKGNLGKDDALSAFDFSFGTDASGGMVQTEEPISPFDRRVSLDDTVETDLPIKTKRFGIPKLHLEIPASINSRPSTPSCPPGDDDDDAAEIEALREQAGSRCVVQEETVYTEDGVEERRYVYYPTQLSMDLQRSSALSQQMRPVAHRQPPHYTNFPPPPHPEDDTHEHKKKSSTSSSRSQMTFSTFGGGHNKYEQESQVTDYEDYEADEEEEDAHENYTCASSFVSASSYPASEVSAGDESCFTLVPQRLSAASKAGSKSGKRSSKATVVEEDVVPLPALPIDTTKATPAENRVSTARTVMPRTSFDIVTSAAMPHVSFGLPPTPEHKNPRKSASTSHLSTPARPPSAQSSTCPSRLSSNSCNNLNTVADRGSVPSVKISRVLTPETAATIDNSEGSRPHGLFPFALGSSTRRSVTPTPSMFRNTDGGNNSKLRVIEEEPQQRRPNTAPPAPEYQSSRSFFEDYDDTEDVETGLSKVKRFLARCLSVKSLSRPLSVSHEGGTLARKKAEEKKKAKKFEGVQEAMRRYKDKKLDEMPVPPPRPSSRFSRMSRMSRVSRIGRGSGKWRWSYAMMGATFS